MAESFKKIITVTVSLKQPEESLTLSEERFKGGGDEMGSIPLFNAITPSM